MKRYYLIYKITNNINGKYYIGRHSTKKYDDGYMGSGTGIRNAIKKYGVENFTKEIIAETWSAEDLWELEKIIVNDEVVKDRMSYNLAHGGTSYLEGLKKYDYDKFLDHQRHAAQCFAKVAKNYPKSKDWHAKGGSVSSKKRSAQYLYQIITPAGEEFIVNGYEFNNLCKEKGWNHVSLKWKVTEGRFIMKGPHKGFYVKQLSKYVKEDKERK